MQWWEPENLTAVDMMEHMLAPVSGVIVTQLTIPLGQQAAVARGSLPAMWLGSLVLRSRN